MENASKAIIMAGGILIALIILSALILLFSHMGTIYIAEGEVLSEKQLEEYNRRFNTYDRSLYGSELLSLANLISDYDYRLLYQENEKGQFYEDNKIKVYVSFGQDIQGYRDENNKWVYKPFKKRQNADLLEDFKKYNDNLEEELAKAEETGNKEHYASIKSQLTEIRSLPFVCINDKTLKNDKIMEYIKNTYNETSREVVKYNKYGRISEMHFVQVLDTDISGVIYK